MAIDSRCPGTQCCNDPITRAFNGCYDPNQCEACIGGRVVRNDPDLLRADCKECTVFLRDPLVDPKLDNYTEILNLCQDWEGCCYGNCYNLICQKCNHTTKQVENKCKDSGSSFTCCKKANGSVAQCYDPTDCKECNTITGEVREKTCPILNTNGIQVQEVCCGGICYNPLCNDCDPNTKTITSKCTQGTKTQCCFDNGTFQGCYDPYACEYCTVNGVSNSLTANQKENCWKCDANGNSYQDCSGSKCCVNQSSDPKIGICITPCQQCQNGIVVDQCSSNEFCCYDECLPKNSDTTCKGCFPDDDGNLEVKENKCGWIIINETMPASGGDTRRRTVRKTSGETECCGGVCFDPRCSKCVNNQIVADYAKDNDTGCCGGHILQPGEFCCKAGPYGIREVYRKTDNIECCINILGDTGLYNTILQGCCSYGDQGKNTIYDKTTEKCCETAKGPTRTYNFTDHECCGDTTIDKDKYGCCSNGPSNQKYYKYKLVCEKCGENNSGIPEKLYDETLCQECKDSKSITQPDILVLDTCYGRSDGKTTCCEGTGICFNKNNECETCKDEGLPSVRLSSNCDQGKTCCIGKDDSNKDIYDCCTSEQGCCNGVCYDNTPTSCQGCVNNQITNNKCESNTNGKTFCCNGTCMDLTCKKCTTNNTIEDKCPDDPSKPGNIFCCNGVCYNICQTCEKNTVVDYPDCDCCQVPLYAGSNSTRPTCCRSSENEKCCLNQCVPSNYIECDGQCVPLDQCCNLNPSISTGQIIESDEICCDNQVYKKNICGECCDGKCTETDCDTECCLGNCCKDDPIKGEVQCCNGYGGGCFYPKDCKKCNNGTINSTLADHERCCDGFPYSPRDCEKCVNNVKVPYTPTAPNCYCYYSPRLLKGKEYCGCPLSKIRIDINTANTGHCCDAAIFRVVLISSIDSSKSSVVGTVNLNNYSNPKYKRCQDPYESVYISAEKSREIIQNLGNISCCWFSIRLDCAIEGDAGFGPGRCHTSIAKGNVVKIRSDNSEEIVWSGQLDNTQAFNICDETLLV